MERPPLPFSLLGPDFASASGTMQYIDWPIWQDGLSMSDASSDVLVEPNVYPRCRLCNFKLEDGDSIVVVSELGRNNRPTTVASGVRVRIATLLSMLPGSSPPPLEDEKELIACHLDCIELAYGLTERPAPERRAGSQHSLSSEPARGRVVSQLTSRNIYTAMAALRGQEPIIRIIDPLELPKMLVERLFGGDRRSWEMPVSREAHKQRLKSIREELVFHIRQTMDPARKVPTEIWLMIARYLTKLYATTKFVEPLPEAGSTVKRDVSDIWATYAKIDGKIYLAKLSNEPSMGAIMLRRRRPLGKMTETKLFVKMDHIGIRNIFLCKTPPPFLTSADDPTEYMVYSLEKRDIRLKFFSDGVVLTHFMPEVHAKRSGASIAMERLFGGLVPGLFY